MELINFRYPLALVLALLAQPILPPTDHGAELSVAALVVILLGVPHGAADHLLFRRALRAAGRSWTAILPRFLLMYTLLTVGYLLLWWWLPAVSLGLFLLLSAYHFGQTQYHEIQMSRWLRPFLFLAFGAFAIGFPVLWHFPTAAPILEALVPGMPTASLAATRQIALGILAGNLVLAAGLWWRGNKAGGWALLDLLTLSLLYVTLPLLLGFGLFFLLWHAYPALVDQYRFLREAHQKPWPWRRYLCHLLPLSIGALLVLAGFLVFRPDGGQAAELAATFFLFISVITLPHAILVDGVYRS